jgi:hypothetical protein
MGSDTGPEIRPEAEDVVEDGVTEDVTDEALEDVAGGMLIVCTQDPQVRDFGGNPQYPTGKRHPWRYLSRSTFLNPALCRLHDSTKTDRARRPCDALNSV